MVDWLVFWALLFFWFLGVGTGLFWGWLIWNER